MLFRQLFDPETSTYTYLLADTASGEALIIDPVLEQIDRDQTLLRELGLRLRYTLETHIHADHVTAAAKLRATHGSQVVLGAATQVEAADILLGDGERLAMGSIELIALSTPGHTNGCTTWYCPAAGMAFTGDALLIRGCGRTDFQQGSAPLLWESVHQKLFTLPDDTTLYPAHDYKGRNLTTVSEEKQFNARLGKTMTKPGFVELMDNLNLVYPKRIDVAVPANLTCGEVVSDNDQRRSGAVAAVLETGGRQDAELWLGDGI